MSLEAMVDESMAGNRYIRLNFNSVSRREEMGWSRDKKIFERERGGEILFSVSEAK